MPERLRRQNRKCNQVQSPLARWYVALDVEHDCWSAGAYEASLWAHGGRT
ncbi:hypothetical protein E1A91_A10G055000v1 [Gossypium mustelinum]|uniref:Uncharacterized protein n=1 Tax=Gossypium mustelinum TaxID=34275 RepID=A0A5D2XHL8_GOSMU|nr:hypothetical protein E1A91_A10G055000v1 [Gossypium mustelinum]